MGLFRQVYWSRLPFPPPGDLTQGRNPHPLRLLHCQADCVSLEPPGKPKQIVVYPDNIILLQKEQSTDIQNNMHKS